MNNSSNSNVSSVLNEIARLIQSVSGSQSCNNSDNNRNRRSPSSATTTTSQQRTSNVNDVEDQEATSSRRTPTESPPLSSASMPLPSTPLPSGCRSSSAPLNGHRSQNNVVNSVVGQRNNAKTKRKHLGLWVV